MTLLRDMPREDRERTVSDAMNIMRQDYYADVAGVAEDVTAHLREQYEGGERGEQLRESLLEYLHQTVDGTQRVIYTFQAQCGLLCSDNSGAYVDNFGPEGMVEGGEIQWSRLMYAAMEQDVIEHLDANGLDPNDPEAFFAGDDDED